MGNTLDIFKWIVNPVAAGSAKGVKKVGGSSAAQIVSPQTEIGVPAAAEQLGITEPMGLPATPGRSAEDEAAIRLERERLERRRRGRGSTILTSPTGASLGLPGTASRLTGGATILGG